MSNPSGRGISARLIGGAVRASQRGYRGHAIEAAAAAPEVFVLAVSFTVTKTAITVDFTTSEAASCSIGGALYTPEVEDFSVWYANAAEHGTSHSHTKTGLVADTLYAIRVSVATDEGASAEAPTALGYFVVRTANAEGAGGGLNFTKY